MGRQDFIFGDLSRLEAMRRGSVKGNLVISRARYLREHFDGATFAKIAARLGPEARAALESPPAAFSWTALGTLMDIDRAIIEIAMQSDVAGMKPFGEEVARYDLSSVYRLLVRVTMTPAKVLARVPDAYSEYLRPGWIDLQSCEPSRGSFVLRQTALPLYLCRYGIPGWVSAALGLAGASKVEISLAGCVHYGASECAYTVRWDRGRGETSN